MKIAILSAYSFRSPGGVQAHMVDQARALARAGHDVTIMAAGVEKSVYPLPVPWISCGWSLGIPGNGSVAHIALSPRGFFRVLRAMKTFDIVHIHEPFYPFTLGLLHFSRAKMVATFHAQHEPNLLYLFGKYVIGLRRAWRRLKGRFAVSEKAKKTVQRYFKGDVAIMPNGIDLEKKVQRKASSKKGATILFLGRNEARKGIPVLLEAFGRIHRTRKDTRLLLAGPGTDTVEGDGVEGYGFVNEKTKDELFLRADCFCVPSTGKESFGIVLLEGMRAGIPIVASDIPGYRTTLKHEENALIFTPGNSVALEEALLRILDSPKLGKKLVGNGHRVAEAYSWTTLAGKIEEEYTRVLSDERKG